MIDSIDWSTNEVEKRYSDRDLKSVEHFLAFKDLYAEVMGARDINAGGYIIYDPYKTLSMLLVHAQNAVTNMNTRSCPFIPEDELFLQLERNKEQEINTEHKHSRPAYRRAAAGWLTLIAVVLGGIYWSETIFGIGFIAALFFSGAYTWLWLAGHFEERKRRKVIRELESAIGMYQTTTPY